MFLGVCVRERTGGVVTYQIKNKRITSTHKRRLFRSPILQSRERMRNSQHKIQPFLNPLLMPSSPINISRHDRFPILNNRFGVHYIVELTGHWIAPGLTSEEGQDFFEDFGEVEEGEDGFGGWGDGFVWT